MRQRKQVFQGLIRGLNNNNGDLFLAVLTNVCSQYNWMIHAYCLMDNHYHLLIETPEGNLSKGMRQLNGVYTQSINRKHHRVGHLFQGRYKAILVNKDVYLLDLCRYIVLNPVRAKLVETPDGWHCMIGKHVSPNWLAKDFLLRLFASKWSEAIAEYINFVKEGTNQKNCDELQHQVFLGDEAFV